MDSLIKIAIIDSGISQGYDDSKTIKRCTITAVDDGVQLVDGAEDNLGHGTAVYHIISSALKNAEIYVVRVFENSMNTAEEAIVAAMEYCVTEIEPDIIHMSNGITYCENKARIKQICIEAYNKNIVIVAAFDNFGAYSYPAAFETVIGVDVSDDIRKGYLFTDRKDVNIIVPNLSRKVPWNNKEVFVCNGTSFNACYVTIMVANIIAEVGKDFDEVLEKLKDGASKVIKGCLEKEIEKAPKINNAVAFPFNKEIHSLVRFQEQLLFELAGVYDTKYSRNIGKTVGSILSLHNSDNTMVIQDINSINWNADFDTFILGHIKEIEKATHKEYCRYVIEKCLEHSKSLYSLGEIEDSEFIRKEFRKKGLDFFVPRVCKKNIPKPFNGKLRCIGAPILGVFGTSSRQGKFSLQLQLRKYFNDKGIKIGQLGTEPTAPLFGFDETYPMGYESTVESIGCDSIAVLNRMMSNIEDKNPELILIGSQSQTIPQQTGNLELYVLQQHEFILATEPDAVILCINIFDEDEYVERTISYIEAIINTEVIALVLFPMTREIIGGVVTNRLKPAGEEIIENTRKRLQHIHKRKVFIHGKDIDQIGNLCMDYFCKDG